MTDLSKEAKGLIKFRKYHQLTQKDLARKTEKNGKIMVSQAHLSKIENGQRSPTSETIKKIIEPFNISYVDFLVDYCGYEMVETDEEALVNSKNKNDPLQQFFSTFVDISEIKGFELDGNPLSNEEQSALFSLIKLIKTNKEKEEKLFEQWQEQNNKDKD